MGTPLPSSSPSASLPSSGGAKLGGRGGRQLTGGMNSPARKQEELMASCLAPAERIRRLQCTGSHGKQNLPGEAEVWDWGRQPAVLPVQLEVSQHGTREGQCLGVVGSSSPREGVLSLQPPGRWVRCHTHCGIPRPAGHTVTGECSDGFSVLFPLCLHRGCPWGKALTACLPRLVLLLD